jgi:hypothetical protein
MKCSMYNIIYKGNGLRLAICARYSWEMALNVDLAAYFLNMQDWKGAGRNQGKLLAEQFT